MNKMRKLNQNKKGIMFFTIIIAISAVAILTMVLINYASRPAQSLEESMGIKQYGLIQKTLTSMEVNFYIKQIAKYELSGTLKKSFKTLHMPLNSPCQTYCNVQMINTETQFCEPDYGIYLEEKMNEIIDSKINKMGESYNLNIPEKNYIISILNKSISFIAKEPVTYTSYYMNYSFFPSFEVKSEQEIIETNNLLEKLIQLNQTCSNQPLSCIQTWLEQNPEFSVIGSLYNIDCADSNSESLKYHIFNYKNNLADTNFAIYINSNILNSGEQQEFNVESGFTYTFQDSNEDTHTVTITSVSEEQIQGTIESNPISFSLEPEQELIFDITNDGTYDLYISFDEFTTDSKAKLTFVVFDKPPEQQSPIVIPELQLIPSMRLPDNSCHLGRGSDWYITSTSTQPEPQTYKTIYPSNAFVSAPKENLNNAKGRYFQSKGNCNVGDTTFSCGTLDSEGYCNCLGESGITSSAHKSLVSEIVQWQEPDMIPNNEPTFPSGVIRFTGYYIPQYSDFCGNNEPLDCPSDKWSEFRSDGRMQGTFFYKDNKYYSYTSIPELPNQYLNLEGNEGAKSSMGTTVQAGRTIAVNSNPEAPGYIPYGSRVYIFIEPLHWANGWYIAEDTGGHFYCCPKIDIFAGLGLEGRSRALSMPSTGDVWVFPPIQGEPNCPE